MLTATELARLAISEEHACLSLLVVVDLNFIEGIVNVFTIIFVLLLTFRVFEEVLVFCFEHTLFTVSWMVSVDDVRDRGCLNDRTEKFKDSFLDLSWCLV